MPSHDYWLERWREQRIGFHEPGGNGALRRHWPWRGQRVLVPLCGKATDLRWLAEQGNEVVGVELAESAAREFFAEQALEHTVTDGPLPAYRATDLPLAIYVGDYFAFDGPLDGRRCDALYDRAALVAVHPDERARYVEHTKNLLTADAKRLVITFCYDQNAAAGPPFAVPDDEVRRYWSDLARLEACCVLEHGPPKFRAAGLAELLETVWRSPT